MTSDERLREASVQRMANALHEAGIGCKPNIPYCRASHRGHATRILAALPSPDDRDRLAALGEAVERLVEHLSPRTQFVIELEHTDFGWHVSVRDFGNRVILPSVRDTRPTLPDAVAAALDEPTGAAQEERA